MTPTRLDGFAPLRSYAMLGDMRAAALVATDGAVDWLAMPRMDSPPVCAALLDPRSGGSVTLAPSVPYSVSRRYLDETMVLETTYTTDRGTVRVTDALNRGALGLLPWTELARVVTADSGEVPMTWSVSPGHRLAHTSRPWARSQQGIPLLTIGESYLAVVTDGAGEARIEGHSVHGETTVAPGRPALLAVVGTEEEPLHTPAPEEVRARVELTVSQWRSWTGSVRYGGPWRETVLRSALTLKALTSQNTGAITGAATTSLPEKIGAGRNNDYRFAWIRDGSYALDVLARLGLTEELHAGVAWMLDAVAHEAPELRPFYAVDGTPVSARMDKVGQIPGYRHSLPVHVGNGAADQAQFGSYGDLLDAVWHYVEHRGRLDGGTADMLATMADRVCDVWQTPDAGFWELGDPQHYTSSKIGCWTALDRAVRLAEKGHLSTTRQQRWQLERDGIRDWVNENCWSQTKHSYTMYPGTDTLDAAALLAARTGFCQGDDPRLHGTVDAVRSELGAGGCLLYRYSGQWEEEGAFLVCSAWLIEALVRIRRVGEAEELLEDFVRRANDVGLYTEEIDPGSDELLGNIPQALTHLGVIGAATSVLSA